MSLRFLDVDAARNADLPWPDLYFSPGYGAAVEVSDGARWEVAVWEPGPILQPMLWRPVDPAITGGEDLFDLISPYGYAGAWAPEGTAPDAWAAFRAAYRAAAIDRGAVAEFLRMGALVPGALELEAADADLEVEHRQDTVVVDLSGGYDAWWTGAQGRCRTSVRKARKNGWTARLRAATAEDLAAGSPFRSLYEGTMARVGASAYYTFPDGYYAALGAATGDDLWVVEASQDGEIGAASLFLRWGDLLHYHLSGSTRQAGRDGVNNLVLEAALSHGIERGVTRFHLGGGLGGEDALLKFKLSFGGARLPYKLGRAVLDPDRYARLIDARAAETSRTADALQASGWFPAYRA